MLFIAGMDTGHISQILPLILLSTLLSWIGAKVGQHGVKCLLQGRSLDENLGKILVEIDKYSENRGLGMVVSMVLLFNAKAGVQMSVSICCTHWLRLTELIRKPKKKLSRMVERGDRHSAIVYCEGGNGGQCYQISGWPSVPPGDVPNPKWWLIRMENNGKYNPN